MMTASEQDSFPPGFKDPVLDSQASFRRILDATAYPGRIQTIDCAPAPPAGFCPAAAALCLTLVDFETPLWLDEGAATREAMAYLRFHCGASLTADAHSARFALFADPERMPSLSAFGVGEDKYPDRSATLLLQVPSLTEGPRKVWSGPGIRKSVCASIAGLPEWFWGDWNLNGELYPLGVDVFFVSRNQVVGLPRSVRSED
jgi:alpha-D-ribose 1-methylphosphonate 5-triphosphate synthase subunit PhnH